MFYDASGALDNAQKDWIRKEIDIQLKDERKRMEDWVKTWVREEIRVQISKLPK